MTIDKVRVNRKKSDNSNVNGFFPITNSISNTVNCPTNWSKLVTFQAIVELKMFKNIGSTKRFDKRVRIATMQ